MKKVWIIEEFSPGEGRWNRFPFISDSRKKDAVEFMEHYLFQEQKRGKKPLCRVVGLPLPRKTVDVWVVMGNYGYGWEAETAETTRKEGLERLAEYRADGPGSYKLIKRRIKRQDYETGNF